MCNYSNVIKDTAECIEILIVKVNGSDAHDDPKSWIKNDCHIATEIYGFWNDNWWQSNVIIKANLEKCSSRNMFFLYCEHK